MHKTSLSEIRVFLDSVPFHGYPRVAFVHSGLFPFGILEGGLSGLTELLQDWIGPGGTLLMPTFNFGKRLYWHQRETPSETGVLTEFFRNQKDAVRTIHPVHSVSIWGALANYLSSDIENSSFGPTSVFAKLYSLKATNISLGTEFEGGATYLHYIEELANVYYREFVKLDAKVVDLNGLEVRKEFTYFARKTIQGKIFNNNWATVFNDLKANQLLIESKVGPAKLMHSNIYEAGSFFLKKLIENPSYCIYV